MKDKPWHVEGQNNSEWILMDYECCGTCFQKHVREFYDIESLWGDAIITQISPFNLILIEKIMSEKTINQKNHQVQV